MPGIVQIVPVGHTSETLVDSIKESIKEYPLSKVVLVLGKKDDENEKKAQKTADEVEKSLGIILCERIKIDLEDVLAGAEELVKRIREEKKQNEVMLNLSGSLRTVDIAGYIAASITNCKVIIGLPAYKNEKPNEKPSGVRSINYIPLIPVERISPEKLEVLGLLVDGKPKSLDDLVNQLRKKSKVQAGTLKSKINFHLKDLREKNFVKTGEEKKPLLFSITGLGKVYYAGLI